MLDENSYNSLLKVGKRNYPVIFLYCPSDPCPWRVAGRRHYIRDFPTLSSAITNAVEKGWIEENQVKDIMERITEALEANLELPGHFYTVHRG